MVGNRTLQIHVRHELSIYKNQLLLTLQACPTQGVALGLRQWPGLVLDFANVGPIVGRHVCLSPSIARVLSIVELHLGPLHCLVRINLSTPWCGVHSAHHRRHGMVPQEWPSLVGHACSCSRTGIWIRFVEAVQSMRETSTSLLLNFTLGFRKKQKML